MADLTDGLVGLALSTLSIVVLGEIVPQAACSRYGLYIGANTVWVVKIFIIIMYVVAWPISVILDIILGRDIGQVYSAAELHKLIRIHVENPDAQEESGLNKDDGNLLTGALEYKDKTVADVMTTIEKVFMLDLQTRLIFPVLMEIYKSGFTRIPIYEFDRQNIVGILFTKDLILIDPDDGVEIAAVISFHGNREGGFVRGVPDDTSLDKVFREFKSSYLHLLVAYGEVSHGNEMSGMGGMDDNRLGPDVPQLKVRNDHISDYTTAHSLTGNRRVVTGVITLEDVLEAVIKDEIVDETDNFVDVNKTETRVRGRGGSHRPDSTNFLTLFEHKIRNQTKLSDAETAAIIAFLSLNVPEFKKLARYGGVLKKLVNASQVEERDANKDEGKAMNVGFLTAHRVEANTIENVPSRRSTLEGKDIGSFMTSRSESSIGIGNAISGELPSSGPIFCKGQSSSYFVLILQGKVLVHAGADDFESELGPWCFVGQKALTTDPFTPDFRATPLGLCRLLFIRRDDYKAAMRAAQVEAMSGSRSVIGEENPMSIREHAISSTKSK